LATGVDEVPANVNGRLGRSELRPRGNLENAGNLRAPAEFPA